MSIFRRGDSSFYWYHFIFEGRHYQASTKLTNKIAAQRAEAIRKAELAQARAGIAERKLAPTLKEYAPIFLERVKPEIRPSSYRGYSLAIRTFLPWFGAKRLNEIPASEINEFKQSRLTDGCAGATVNRDLATLRRILSLAMKDDLIQVTPFSAHRIEFLEENRRERVLSFGEENRYLTAATQPLRDVAIVMLETGLRPGEAMSLRREDLLLNLPVPFAHVAAGKTRNAIRDVPLAGRALAVLRLRRANFEGEYLFPRRIGNGYNGSLPMNELEPAHLRALQESGITLRFRVYDLRHTYGTRFIEAGGDPLTLARLMGHADLKTTQRYVHLSKRHLADAAQRMAVYRAEREFETAKAAGRTSGLTQ